MPYNLYKSGKKFRSRNGLVRYGRGGRRRLPRASRGQFRDDVYGDSHLNAAASNIDAAGYNVDAGLSHWESTGDLYGSFTAAGYDLGNRGGAPNATRNNTSAFANQGYGGADAWRKQYLANLAKQRAKQKQIQTQKFKTIQSHDIKNRITADKSTNLRKRGSRFHRV
tara:strand:- start:3754 stop:4254 length:501 start_codon:yes stop_codon:yes gene_type:complete